jgi:hypothetical protein
VVVGRDAVVAWNVVVVRDVLVGGAEVAVVLAAGTVVASPVLVLSGLVPPGSADVVTGSVTSSEADTSVEPARVWKPPPCVARTIRAATRATMATPPRQAINKRILRRRRRLAWNRWIISRVCFSRIGGLFTTSPLPGAHPPVQAHRR